MPFTRVYIAPGKDSSQKQNIARSVHQALVDALGIPADDFFQLLVEYEPGNFFYDRKFLNFDRSGDLVVVDITLRRGRSEAMKRELYAQVVDNLARSTGARPQDVFIYLSENDFSDWSVGGGVMSMAISQVPGRDG